MFKLKSKDFKNLNLTWYCWALKYPKIEQILITYKGNGMKG